MQDLPLRILESSTTLNPDGDAVPSLVSAGTASRFRPYFCNPFP
jgi:hypothetical protein